MDLRQQELARAAAVNESGIGWRLWGGYEDAERKRLVVYPEWEAEGQDKIACLRISCKDFKDQSIGHRDYLGAVLNLGIKREKLGDIAVQEGKAYLFADLGLADYICQQLERVKNTSVAVESIDMCEFIFQTPELGIVKASLASLRLDAAVAAAFNLSRANVETLIQAGNVKINQMETTKPSAAIKEGDLVSVRGQGRFRLEEVGGLSRKGRYHVQISRW